MNIFIIILLIITSIPVQAGVYRCEVDGKVVFADFPCGKNSEELEIIVVLPDNEEVMSAHQRNDEMKRQLTISHLNKNIEVSERNIEKYIEAMDREVDWLSSGRDSWLRSMDLDDSRKSNDTFSEGLGIYGFFGKNDSDSEIDAVVAKYKIRREEDNIKYYRDQIANIYNISK